MLSTVTTLLAVSSVPLAYWTFVLMQRCFYIAKCRRRAAQLPGLPILPVIGNIHQVPLPMDGRFNVFLRELTEQFPRVFHLLITPYRATVMVNHPDTVKILMKSSEPKDTQFAGEYRHMKPWVGLGLLLSAGDQWFRNRRLLTSAFHFEILKPYMTIFNECTDILLEKWLPVSQSGDVIDIYGDVSLVALNVILRCAFSSEEDVQRMGATHPYVKSVYKLTEISQSRALRPLTHINSLYYMTTEGKEFLAHCDHVHQVARDVIDNRKKELESSDIKTSNHGRLDFLDILLSAKDDDGVGLTDQEIRNEVDTFLFGGHDTTASGMSWIIYAMASHPEYQQTAREEIDELLKDREESKLEWDDLNNMPFLTRCIKEALRLYSPVPTVGRMLSKPLELEGVELLPDTTVLISFYAMHHNPLVWGEDHMEYKPDRFLHENISKMDSYAFCPFAAGPRNCIGQNFAMNEMKTMIARTIHKYILEVDAECDKPMTVPYLVQRSTNGIQIKIKPRPVK